MARNEIMADLQALGIATRPGTHAVHMLALYAEDYGLKDLDYPVAKACDANTMAIPLHNRMVKEDFQYVVDALRKF